MVHRLLHIVSIMIFALCLLALLGFTEARVGAPCDTGAECGSAQECCIQTSSLKDRTFPANWPKAGVCDQRRGAVLRVGQACFTNVRLGNKLMKTATCPLSCGTGLSCKRGKCAIAHECTMHKDCVAGQCCKAVQVTATSKRRKCVGNPKKRLQLDAKCDPNTLNKRFDAGCPSMCGVDMTCGLFDHGKFGVPDRYSHLFKTIYHCAESAVKITEAPTAKPSPSPSTTKEPVLTTAPTEAPMTTPGLGSGEGSGDLEMVEY